MTCIVGVERDGKVWIGADSAGVDTDALLINERADEKVFRNGEFLMAFCGSFRARDLARYAFKPPAQTKKQSDVEYLVTTWMDAFRGTLRAGGMQEEDNLLDPESTFLLGYRGHLYNIDYDFQVGRTTCGFTADGCGYAFAMGALHVMAASKPPALRVRHALEAAARFSAGVCGPFKVMSL
jgi:ATP-dependent protease HslVU (ClpYQ) peptidase subunit